MAIPDAQWCSKCQSLLFDLTFYNRLMDFEKSAEDSQIVKAFQADNAANVKRKYPLLVDMFMDASMNVRTSGPGHRHSVLSSCFSRALLTRSGKLDVGMTNVLIK
jgi:hypothetical protein